MVGLFDPIVLRKLTVRNRLWMAPMCQAAATPQGLATDWHRIHYGSRSVGGVGLVIVEATAVNALGRIGINDLGLWNDQQTQSLASVARAIREYGAVAAIQLGHAGRKAAMAVVQAGGASQPVAPSPLAFDGHPIVPHELNEAEILRLVDDFASAARRALEAGFQVVEVHAAHGYLLHQFLSPLSNKRMDGYGGSLANRSRLVVRIVQAIRAFWPSDWPLLVRISATDWVAGGWDLDQSVALAEMLKNAGADLIDCSSGGSVAVAPVPVEPGYQVTFADAIRRRAGIDTGAVGLITQPDQAQEILSGGQADVVLLGRALLSDPYWVLHAATNLKQWVDWPTPYGSVKPKYLTTP